ncbi:MAG: sulfite exporter TauE/SafE family protein [Armatimonadetes bacterium]|nr:sulfite exporter TauE/SafE family protein [Armatimonadota bacterium]
MQTALLIVGGLAAGVLGGLFGTGGGIIIVPFLVFALGFEQHKAQGTSLVALLAPVGLLGVANYWKEGNADLKSGAWVAAGFFFGAWIGSKVALSLPEDVMRRSFATLLVAVGLYMFLRK